MWRVEAGLAYGHRVAGGDSVGAGDGNCTTDEGDYGVGIYGGFSLALYT